MEAGVPRIEETAGRRSHSVATPQGSIAIERGACTEMPCRRAGHRRVPDPDRIPPVDLIEHSCSELTQELGESERNDPACTWLQPDKGAYGPGIEVVVVVVREQHDVDRRQCIDRHSRWNDTSRSENAPR